MVVVVRERQLCLLEQQRADVEQLAPKRELSLLDQPRIQEVADEPGETGRFRSR